MSQPPIDSSDRIRDLWSINADVPTLLTSASNAINALTDRSLQHTSDEPMDDTPAKQDLAAHKAAFTESSKAYFTALQAILARLRRSVYALEEAGVIEAEAPVVSNSRDVAERKAEGESEKVTNGGLGNLDVGVLNARVNGVGRGKEAELLQEARTMLWELGEKTHGNGRDGED